MSGGAWTAIAFVVIFGAGVGLVAWSEYRYTRDWEPLDFPDAPHQHRDAAIEPVPDPCAALGRPMTVQEAHRQTQLHAEHAASECPRKAQALAVLTRSGRMVPDRRRVAAR